MKPIVLFEDYAVEYIHNEILAMKNTFQDINNAKFHHNTGYDKAASVCRNGILTIRDLAEKGIKKYTKESLELMKDTDSHVNGDQAVSLAVVGLDDIYPSEEEYNPTSPYLVDFLVSSSVVASRSSIHYGNEFLSYKSIPNDKLRSVDIRILELIEMIDKKGKNANISAKEIIVNYNFLKDIALAIKSAKLEIPVREMSDQANFSLDIDKLIVTPKVLIK